MGFIASSKPNRAGWVKSNPGTSSAGPAEFEMKVGFDIPWLLLLPKNKSQQRKIRAGSVTG
jgi:hypothetical protein